MVTPKRRVASANSPSSTAGSAKYGRSSSSVNANLASRWRSDQNGVSHSMSSPSWPRAAANARSSASSLAAAGRARAATSAVSSSTASTDGAILRASETSAYVA